MKHVTDFHETRYEAYVTEGHSIFTATVGHFDGILPCAHDIIANIRHAWLDECAVRAMRKKLKLSSDGGDSGSKKYMRSYGMVWRSLCLAGVCESGGRFCVGAFGRNLASIAVKMFSHSIYFVKKFYKFCNFNAICKDNAAINCITVQHTKKVRSGQLLTSNSPLVPEIMYISYSFLGRFSIWWIFNDLNIRFI
jgi:hypothetical protein